jgi:hypothetical protein
MSKKLKDLESAVKERENLMDKIRTAGQPPHSDFWGQSIWLADKEVDDAYTRYCFECESNGEIPLPKP